jgi:hypothetical protein
VKNSPHYKAPSYIGDGTTASASSSNKEHDITQDSLIRAMEIKAIQDFSDPARKNRFPRLNFINSSLA